MAATSPPRIRWQIPDFPTHSNRTRELRTHPTTGREAVVELTTQKKIWEKEERTLTKNKAIC